jgi:hypothetical protein
MLLWNLKDKLHYQKISRIDLTVQNFNPIYMFKNVSKIHFNIIISATFKSSHIVSYHDMFPPLNNAKLHLLKLTDSNSLDIVNY